MAGLTFEHLGIAGVVLVRTEPLLDERGSFGRTFDAELFAAAGLPTMCVQESASRNLRAGTLRGLHGSAEHHPEAKYVSCTRGRIFDVVVDARSGSPTYSRWITVELAEERDEQLFIPAGCLHGFQTLEDATVVRYRMDRLFDANAFVGVHYESTALAIAWPLPPVNISARDLALPPFPGS